VEGIGDDLPRLVQAVFFARWCNKQTTLDELSWSQLDDSSGLQQRLQLLPGQPWCNITAYPVGPVTWGGQIYSRFDAATVLFGEIKEALAAMIVGADSDVVEATRAINAKFGMANDFPVFMAVMDLAWFRPDVIDPASPVPTGIGAVAFLDRLQEHLGLADHHQTCQAMIELQAKHWPDARRKLAPIDIEYLSCECRKYYSYVNGTKVFEGKNVFEPGKTGTVSFDVDPPVHPLPSFETELIVIAGGPCSGKTTLMEALASAGYSVQPETARTMIEQGAANSQTAADLRIDPVAWQMKVLQEDYRIFEALEPDAITITDTSFIEDLVFADRAGIEVGPNAQEWLRRKRYRLVFFLEPLERYEQSESRMESRSLAEVIGRAVYERYIEYGYAPVRIPAASVSERVDLITAAMSKAGVSSSLD